MPKFTFTVKNKLSEGQYGRNVAVYNSSDSVEAIIAHGNFESFNVPINDVDASLAITVTGAPGNLKNWCWAHLPANDNFVYELISNDVGSVSTKVSGSTLILAIPPGSPDWLLKIGSPGKKSSPSKGNDIILTSETGNVTPGGNGP
ncbi:MAG: hypothetical protein KAW12_00870 [Candidatus Aminicenantes bacterium]|nr:hypothetical protein [Candidatus Aminicenantes bacterium]